jgi:hypothetical protein
MAQKVSRRDAISGLAALPVVLLAGCGQTPTRLTKAKLIIIAVAKKLTKITTVGLDLAELVVEIKAILDGKEETIQARITKEEAEALKNGGQLVIKDEDGKEFPVEYQAK